MQPHKGLSSKDSFAPCQQTDIFSHIRSPKQPLRPLQLQPLLDSLENEQEVIDRLILGKPILKPIYFLAKGGKGVVVFLLFPFHFFLFRIPKWAVAKFLPLAFQASSKVVLKSKEYLNRLMQEIALKMQVLNRLQEALKAFSPLLKSLFKETAHYLNVPFAAVSKKVKENFEKTFPVMKLFISTFSNKIETLLSVFNKMGYLMKKAVDLAKESERTRTLFIPFKKPIEKTVENIKKGWDSLLEKGRNELEKQKKKLEELFLKLSKLKEVGKNKALKVLERIQEAKEKLLEIKIELKEIIAPKVEMAFIGMQKTVQVFNPGFVFVANLMSQAGKRSFEVVGRQVKVLQFAKSCVEFSKKIFKKMSVQEAVIRSFQRLFHDAFAAGKKLSKKTFDIALKGKEKIKQKMKLASQFLLTFLKILVDYFMKILKKIVRFFSLCCKWCRIMAKFTYYLSQEILMELQTI